MQIKISTQYTMRSYLTTMIYGYKLHTDISVAMLYELNGLIQDPFRIFRIIQSIDSIAIDDLNGLSVAPSTHSVLVIGFEIAVSVNLKNSYNISQVLDDYVIDNPVMEGITVHNTAELYSGIEWVPEEEEEEKEDEDEDEDEDEEKEEYENEDEDEEKEENEDEDEDDMPELEDLPPVNAIRRNVEPSVLHESDNEDDYSDMPDLVSDDEIPHITNDNNIEDVEDHMDQLIL